ncbi:GNAT family N-acetyltransferase [Alkalihalobacillus sp. 1P02AB]|uniref:GNAT family N-acetyltransferase n=1 Tax=Alkalihalobacillus sp. 1P02AB TaxID=3132260 RepID=UPI0039A5AEED
MLIRQETINDYDKVYALVKDAFKVAEHSDGNEQDLVVALREGDAFIPELSLVAEVDGKIAGHVLFTKAKVGNDTVLVLAPLSVLPEYQSQGIGTVLIKKGHKIAEELGYKYSLVLGSEKYYPRLGYIPAEKLGVLVPVGIPSVNFMGIQLQENAKPISGAVIYAKEFGV